MIANVNVVFGAEVQKVFTEVVSHYLSQGMTYHLASMSGHQGEIAKVDVTDGKDVYRINLDRESCCRFGDNEFWGDVMTLTVERFDGEATQEIRSSHTLWTGKGEEVSRRVWYKISDRGRRDVWTTDLDDAKAYQSIQRERSRLRDDYSWKTDEIDIHPTSEEQLTKVRDMCRTHRGYARVKRVHIDKIVKSVWRNEVTYRVVFTEDCGKDALVIKRVKAEA